MARMPLPVRFAALSRLPSEVVAVVRILSTPGHSSHFIRQTINFDHSLSIGFNVDISVAHSQTDIERKLCCSTLLGNVYSRPMTRKIEKKDPAKRSIERATCAKYNVKLAVTFRVAFIPTSPLFLVTSAAIGNFHNLRMKWQISFHSQDFPFTRKL